MFHYAEATALDWLMVVWSECRLLPPFCRILYGEILEGERQRGQKKLHSDQTKVRSKGQGHDHRR